MSQSQALPASHVPPLDPKEFGGPFGAGALTLGLPAIVFYLWVSISTHGGALFLPTSGEEWRALLAQIPIPTTRATVLFGAWFGYQALMQLYAPGKWIEGTRLPDGTRLKYKMNGLFTFIATALLLGVLVGSGALSPTVFYDNYGPLFATATLFCFGYSVFLYGHGAARGKPYERTHHNFVHDFFMGKSLNPRTGNFDHKLFCEARPGLMLWLAGDLSLAAAQYQLSHTVTTAMILVCAFHFLYVADYYLHEEAILTTWDVKHENFGFMLCFGDLAWVPFSYTFQAYYLVTHPHALPVWAVAGIASLNLAGYYIFRSVNLQKHRFRTDPERPIWGKKPEFIRTKSGNLLLVSGWWGWARHFNYTGDLMMATAWCLPCGFGHAAPYFYVIYFTALLLMRERRDNNMCREKYGSDWNEYCQRVKWRILPGVY